MRRLNIFTLFLLGGLIAGFSGCKTYDTPPPVEGNKPEEGLSLKVQKKVLWINIDGAVGEVVRQANPQNITKMLEHSKYSWNGLSENRTYEKPINEEDPVNWTSMLTGVIPEKHNVKDYSYLPDFEPDPDNPDVSLTLYPNVLARILENYPMARTVCITPWSRLNANQLSNASDLVTTKNDQETFEKASERLYKSDPMLMLVSFNGMLEAGAKGGFKAENQSYVDALHTIDGYIGDLLDSLNNRENAYFEDWLVIVSPGYGGNPDGDYSTGTDYSRESFGIFYFPHYESEEFFTEKFQAAYIPVDYVGSVVDTLRLPGGTEKHPIYSPYANKEFTMEILLRVLPNAAGSYSTSWCMILGKPDDRSGRAWGIYNSKVGFYPKGGMDPKEFNIPNTWNNPFWHSLVMNVNQTGTSTNMTFSGYADGKSFLLRQSMGRSSYPVVDTVTNLSTGNFKLDRFIAGVRIWNKTLSDEDVLKYANMVDIPATDPNYEHLIGYWRFVPESYDAETMSIKNDVKPDRPFVFNKPLTFHNFVNTLPEYRDKKLALENTLFVPQILYWLGISKPTELDSNVFLNKYSLAEEWREDIENE